MGGCFSDVKGGQQAVGVRSGGGAHQRAQVFGGGAGGANTGPNDAVDFFLRTKGVPALYTQLEVCVRTWYRNYFTIVSPKKLEENLRVNLNSGQPWRNKINPC